MNIWQTWEDMIIPKMLLHSRYRPKIQKWFQRSLEWKLQNCREFWARFLIHNVRKMGRKGMQLSLQFQIRIRIDLVLLLSFQLHLDKMVVGGIIINPIQCKLKNCKIQLFNEKISWKNSNILLWNSAIFIQKMLWNSWIYCKIVKLKSWQNQEIHDLWYFFHE